MSNSFDYLWTQGELRASSRGFAMAGEQGRSGSADLSRLLNAVALGVYSISKALWGIFGAARCGRMVESEQTCFR